MAAAALRSRCRCRGSLLVTLLGPRRGYNHVFRAADLSLERSGAPRAKPGPGDLVFGREFTDHMLSVEWSRDGGWGPPRIHPFRDLRLHPATSALHYGVQAFDEGELLECIRALVRLEQEWVPPGPGTSLYIRPTFIGTERAAQARGCQQVLWLHGPQQLLTEVGTMNLFIFWHNQDGELELVTPPLDGLILPGVTRQSLLELAREESSGCGRGPSPWSRCWGPWPRGGCGRCSGRGRPAWCVPWGGCSTGSSGTRSPPWSTAPSWRSASCAPSATSSTAASPANGPSPCDPPGEGLSPPPTANGAGRLGGALPLPQNTEGEGKRGEGGKCPPPPPHQTTPNTGGGGQIPPPPAPPPAGGYLSPPPPNTPAPSGVSPPPYTKYPRGGHFPPPPHSSPPPGSGPPPSAIL
ncbi:branched-chain-amino-acid aminotransferase, mitochondrial isoform X2 [Larus michahellis]|uniref:branched-chain-amino-acid aminotransferase, mitochondrial isoform X2 n=1 Tax=Larus michahellis TaxID=119627 RepID=UPI003D9AF97F